MPSWIGAMFSTRSCSATTESRSRYPARRRPRREWHERWLEHQSELAETHHYLEEIGACVSLIQSREDGVIHRFDGRRDEQAAGIAQLIEMLGVAQQVLNFDGDVVTEPREFAVERLDDGHGVGGAVEEVGITEGDVLGPRFDLTANVFEHHVALHDTEKATINRHNRTMAAEMLAAAARLRVACDKVSAPRQHNLRILAQRRQARAVRDHEVEPIKRDHRLGAPRRHPFHRRSPPPQVARPLPRGLPRIPRPKSSPRRARENGLR